MQLSTEEEFFARRLGAGKRAKVSDSASPQANISPPGAQATEVSGGFEKSENLVKTRIWLVEHAGIELLASLRWIIGM
jgi:hypothetical protein